VIYKIIFGILLAITSITSASAYQFYGGGFSFQDDNGYGVEVDFPLWPSAQNYFLSFDFVTYVQVVQDSPFAGATKIYFVDDLEPEDYFFLAFELNMMSKMWYNDLAYQMWGFAFPHFQTYYFTPTGSVVACKPQWFNGIGYLLVCN